MKKEEGFVSPYGIAGLVLGVLGIVTSISQPFTALVCSILALVFASKEKAHGDAKWAKTTKILGIIGLVLSIIVFIVGLYAISYLSQNPGVLSQLGTLS